MNPTGRKWRLFLRQPLLLIPLVVLVLVMGGVVIVQTLRHWRDDVIRSNMSLVGLTAHQLAVDAEEYLKDLPERFDEEGFFVITAPRDSLDLQLTLLSARVFAQAPGLKGGFWVLKEQEFMGYSNPWSPPPAPLFGPPPRSYPIILEQVSETIRLGEPIIRLHRFESISVAAAVFPLATEPVRRDGELVAIAWARIHIERELPMQRLSRVLSLSALVAISAFLVAMLTTLYQRREIRSLNENLGLIQADPEHRLPPRRGMFGSIRDAINRMIDSIEHGNRERLSLEEQLHQQDKMAALGNLLAGIAHEVKTPLAILKTRVQIWQRDLRRFSQDTGQEPPLTEDSMQIVLHEIDRLSDLLRKLLYFSRPIHQDQMRPLEADALIRHTVLLVEPRVAQKQVELSLDLGAPGAEVMGDSDSLHQVFLNVLTNSLDMVEDGGSISVTSRPLEGRDRLVVDLTDSGPGLEPEVREKVFTPFFTTRHGGSGLGLAIAYEIVRAHLGTIEFVDPAPPGGAHCRITFPLLPPTRRPT